MGGLRGVHLPLAEIVGQLGEFGRGRGGDVVNRLGRAQRRRIEEDGAEDGQLIRVEQIVEGDLINPFDAVSEVGMDHNPGQVANHQ